VFDADPAKIGTKVGEHVVRPLDELAAGVAKHRAEVAILTLPAEFAQDAADNAAAAGIRALWNFAPTWIAAPPGVRIRHEHLSTGFAELAYHLKQG
ncbi:MAG: redox-sensing transcriptional repressor Rex, partial [FCB group bacterium]|jgi:redox-sensing transcriptional repressor|nr:redox-sensing transcriptional repressor Rex [FCB group bacterium]